MYFCWCASTLIFSTCLIITLSYHSFQPSVRYSHILPTIPRNSDFADLCSDHLLCCLHDNWRWQLGSSADYQLVIAVGSARIAATLFLASHLRYWSDKLFRTRMSWDMGALWHLITALCVAQYTAQYTLCSSIWELEEHHIEAQFSVAQLKFYNSWFIWWQVDQGGEKETFESV